MPLQHALFGDGLDRPYHGRFTWRAESQAVEDTTVYGVFKVYDLKTESPVTLKVYDLRDINAQARPLANAMWESEVRILMQLVPYGTSRLGLVRFVAGSRDEATSTSFVAWEDAYDVTLAEVLLDRRSGRRLEDLHTRIDLVVMLCEAVAELHTYGVIHREITPRTICLWTEGAPRAALSHFGMSVFLNNFMWAKAPDQFQPSKVSVATMAYSAPERLAFLAGLPETSMVESGEDYRQDFYSLGLCLTEWLLRPFAEEERARFLSDAGYDQQGHLEWIIDVQNRILQEQYTLDREAETKLKSLLRTMIDFAPESRFPTASRLVRDAHAIQALFRQRKYQELLKKPFIMLFDAAHSAPVLDKMRPREQSRSNLPKPDMIAAIEQEITEDLRTPSACLLVGPDAHPTLAKDPYNKDRWLIRGRSLLYRLERFRDSWHGSVECPWIAYVYQVLHSARDLDRLERIPFREVRVVPLQKAQEYTHAGRDPGKWGRWDELLAGIGTKAGPSLLDRRSEVLVEALREIHRIAQMEDDLSTYAYRLLQIVEPGGFDRSPLVTLAYDSVRDAEFVRTHDYIPLFERTRSERSAFAASFVPLLSREANSRRLEIGSHVEQLRGRRPLSGVLEAVDASSDPPTLRVRLAPGVFDRDVPPRGFIRESSLNRSNLWRQELAIDRLAADAFRLHYLCDPSLFPIVAPAVRQGWITLEEPDGNKATAIASALTAFPAFFLQGPPGTGKTTAATEVLAQILAENEAARVLVSAQAHEALDNLMEQVLETPLRARHSLLRIPSGSHRLPARIAHYEPEHAVETFLRESARAVDRALRDSNEPDAMRREALQRVGASWNALLSRRHSEFERLLYQSANLVFATCNGSHRLWQHDLDQFNWVIVEEAARAHAPELLIPLVQGHRWLLVGDQLQLEPFKADDYGEVFRRRLSLRMQELDNEAGAAASSESQAASAAIQGTERYLSLFAHLFEHAAPEQRATLTECYRMHPVLCTLTDRVFYRSSRTSDALLRPHFTSAERAHPYAATWAQTDWLAGKALVWLDTSAYPSRREAPRRSDGTSRSNKLEARITAELVARLRAQDPSATVMLITEYRAQRDLLREIIETHWPEGQALTVTASQGKQADIVIFNLVCSNTDERVGRAVGDIRRNSQLNVALSRAKRLLVIVGDIAHFEAFGDSAGGIASVTKMVRHWPDPGQSTAVSLHAPSDLVPLDWAPSAGVLA